MPAPSRARSAYELGALQAAGLMPRFSACARLRGGGRAARRPPRSIPAKGGTSAIAALQPHGGRPAPRTGGARGPAPTPARGSAATAEPLPRELGGAIQDALSRFIEHHLGDRLARRKFLDEVGPLLGH